MSRQVLISLLCTVVFCFAITPSHAQGTAPEETKARDSQKAPVLEELVVTATRRDSGLQTTAVAATVMTGEQMQKKGIFDLPQIQYGAPGLSIGDYGSANTFNMRGIGRSQVDIDLPPGIQLYRDKVPMFPGYFQNEPYYDMAGMEVLRGPQGTLAGKSAAGGAVFIRTQDAVLGERSAFLEGGFGNYSAWETTGMINLPLGENFALRLAGIHRERDHWFKSITGNYTGDPDTRDLNALRLSMTWAPNAKFTAKSKIDLNHLDFGGNATTDFGTDPLRPHADDIAFAYRDRAIRAIVDLSYGFDNGLTLTSVTGYQFSDTINNRSNNSGLGPFDDPALPDSQEIQFLSRGDFTLISQEFNLLSSEDQRLRWVTGVFYQHVDSYIPPYPANGFNLTLVGIGAIFPFVYSPWKNYEDDISVFGNATYDLTDKLEFEAGVRYSHYKRDQWLHFHISPDGGLTLPPILPLGPLLGLPEESRTKISEGSVDFKVGLNWHIRPEHFLYAFVARGHTTGGISIALPNPTYKEVEVFDYEGGWKGTWLDGRMKTQLGVYYQTLSNFQGVFATPADTLGSVTRNAEGESTIYGVELSIQAQFDNLAFDFGGSWNVTELGSFDNILIPNNALRWFPGAVAGDTVDLTGRQSPYSPELTFNIGAEYAFHFGNTVITPRVDFAFIDEQKDGLYDIPVQRMAERKLVNLQVRLEHGPWYGRAYMDNATDEIFIAGIQELGQLRYLGTRRTYGIIVGRNFDW
jgi:iron complex outermembrane receptor protein